MRKLLRSIGVGLFAAFLAIGVLTACNSLTPAQPGGVSQASTVVQRSAITICTAYADALQVAAVLRRSGSLSTNAVASIERVRPQMTATCTSPVTEAGLQSLTDGLGTILAAMKGGG